MDGDPRPEEDQDRANPQSTDGKTGDRKDLKKDTIDDENHVLKWESALENM